VSEETPSHSESIELEINHPPSDHRATNPELVCAVVAKGGGEHQLTFSLNGEPVGDESIHLSPGPGGTAATARLELGQGTNTIVVTARSDSEVVQKVVECSRIERRVTPTPVSTPLSELPGAQVAQVLEQAAEKSKLNSQVAILIALMAIVMGLIKVYSENVGQTMAQTQSSIVDSWNRHQADRIRLELVEARWQRLADADNTARLAECTLELATIRDGVEKSKIRAQESEAAFRALDRKDNCLDFAEASLSMAMALLAMTSLTQKRWLFAVSGIPLLVGLFAGVFGFLLK
jgi:hypothetical protein